MIHENYEYLIAIGLLGMLALGAILEGMGFWIRRKK